MKPNNFNKQLVSFYQLLQVDPRADYEVVHAAYLAMVRKHHPDNGGSNSLCARLNEAKSVLLEPKKRKEYDNFLSDLEKGIIGNYKILKQIGEGAFGRTYKAEHRILKEYACLKQNINISPLDDELLIKEAKTLWHIHHYSLPTLRDFFKAPDGSFVLAMTFVEGPTIDKIVDNHGPMHPEHVCWISQRLLNALHYLHYHGCVHCDIKPQNIIIKPKEHNAILVDYGFAMLKPRHQTKPEGYTAAYAAPELLTEMPPVPETDLYSLGATMIYMLGGNPISKTYPSKTPKPLRDYIDSLILHDSRRRPNWEKEDLVKSMSNLRYKIFGRRTSNRELII